MGRLLWGPQGTVRPPLTPSPRNSLVVRTQESGPGGTAVCRVAWAGGGIHAPQTGCVGHTLSTWSQSSAGGTGLDLQPPLQWGGLSCRGPCRSAPCPSWMSPPGPTTTAALRRVSRLQPSARSPGRPVDWAARGPSREVREGAQEGCRAARGPSPPAMGSHTRPLLISARSPSPRLGGPGR